MDAIISAVVSFFLIAPLMLIYLDHALNEVRARCTSEGRTLLAPI